MTTETTKISVTRALATLKSVEGKLNKAIVEQCPVLLAAGNGTSKSVVGLNLSVEDAEKSIRTSFQSVTDLLALRANLKAAIVQSNATTVVQVGNTSMTVAEAIEAKRSIEFRQELLNRMKTVNLSVTSKFNIANAQFEAKLDTARKEFTSGANKKVSEEDVKVVTDPIELRQKPSIIDPLGISDVISKLEDEVSDFLLNVDFALSESNAKTEITV